MLLSYKTDDVGASKCGILEVDGDNKVTAFLEKPGPDATASRLACPCFYMFSPAALELMPKFLDDRKDGPLAARDAPGNFVRYLSERVSCRPDAFPPALLPPSPGTLGYPLPSPFLVSSTLPGTRRRLPCMRVAGTQRRCA